ncbi:MAG: folylpolyglutamate synthase/dihydrofolate synthase family protein [Sphingomonadales bacterium]
MPDHARSEDPAVQAQLDRFAQLSPGRDILGLERITALLALLGDPHLALPPVFHVAGTNGKGSTCAFLRAALEAAEQRVHVYTSPHLVRFNERIRIAGKLIEDSALAPLLAEVLDVAEANAIGPSFFEATTAAAFLAFSRTPADACVIEVGLGGRLDATNVVTPVVCGIAQVGIDHQAFLGETLAEIAGEKAGIAKPGVPVVCLAQERDALAAIETVVSAAGAPLLLEGRDWQIDETIRPGLAGAHQLRNANLAAQMLMALQREAIHGGHDHQGYEIVRALGWLMPTDGHWRDVFATTTWPARFQRLPDGPLTREGPVWIDGAHNPAAAKVLAQELARQPMHLIIGILANKDADGIIAAIAPHALSLTFVTVPDHDSHDPATLATAWHGKSTHGLEAALAGLPRGQDRMIVGSLYLAGVALRLNNSIPE